MTCLCLADNFPKSTLGLLKFSTHILKELNFKILSFLLLCNHFSQDLAQGAGGD